MPVSDPIADLLTRMRNAQHARHHQCRCPWSRHKEEICGVMKASGFLQDYAVEGESIVEKEIVVTFVPDRLPLELKRMSKPGRRMYSGKGELFPVMQGYGIAVVSTSQGMMTDAQARKRGIGGEVLCTVC